MDKNVSANVLVEPTALSFSTAYYAQNLEKTDDIGSSSILVQYLAT